MSPTFRAIVTCTALLVSACHIIPSQSLRAGRSIEVGHPEVFDNAQLQTSLDTLRGQLASLGIVDTGTLTGALGAVQGTSATQTNFSLQSTGRATPSVTAILPSVPAAADKSDTTTTTTAAQTPTAPAAAAAPTLPTLPSVANDSIGLIEKQMQLESQLQGYQLLLGGSDFARYTISGLAKDRVVIGFPITILPQDQHKNMAAEVEFTYFPPNAKQFQDSEFCKQKQFLTTASQKEYRFSKGDEPNVTAACQEQESTPTIINILPAERSYNVVKLTSSATSIGAAAIVGTVNVGASGAFSHQTQYLAAQQDTVALQGDGSAICDDLSIGPQDSAAEKIVVDGSPTNPDEHCIPGSRGVRFKWQFKPVLGESFVRPGRRVTFVQLAIPNVRRPYPNYGGIVYIRKTWKPIDTDTGVVKEAPIGVPDGTDAADPELAVKNVLGHTFVTSEVTSIDIADQGGGSLLVSLKGTYLTGATVRIGGTLLNTSTPGFISDYNSLQFLTTAQALAQSGAVLLSSEGVESPIDLSSICKFWDEGEECALLPDGIARQERADANSPPAPASAESLRKASAASPPAQDPDCVKTAMQAKEVVPDCERHKFKVIGVTVAPVSDSTSLVRVKLAQSRLQVAGYRYYHYKKNDQGDVSVPLPKREADPSNSYYITEKELAVSLNKWPIVLSLGGKAYGFTDLPFESVTEASDEHVYLSVVASNDTLNASPQLKVQRFFGNPADDSDWQRFVPPGRLTIGPDPQCEPSPKAAATPPAKHTAQSSKTTKATAKLPKASPTCGYVISGAEADNMKLAEATDRGSCKGSASLDDPSPYEVNNRGLKLPACARQVALVYEISRLQEKFSGTIVLNLPPKSGATPATTPDSGPPDGSVTPHFQLVRSAKQVLVSGGTASATVGVQNLKDQTATLAVQNADIVSATDGGGGMLTVQAGNKVTVTQDTNITFQVRNFTPKGFNVQAEGKNGAVSAGKLQFATDFQIIRDPSGTAKPAGDSKKQ